MFLAYTNLHILYHFQWNQYCINKHSFQVEMLVHMSSKDGNDHDYIYPDLIICKKRKKYKNLMVWYF
jgi:hypothetical protein